MRILRGLVIALLTAFAGCVLAFFVGDYLTRLAHVPEMEGQRGMAVFFLCVPLGILAGFLIGIISSILVRRQGPAGFLVAQGWALLIICGIAALLGGVTYLLSDKPPKIDGKFLTLDFEVRVPPSIQLPAEMHDYTVSVSLYTDGTQTRVVQIDPRSIKKDSTGATFSGTVPILSHAASRQLFPSIANIEHGSQFIPLDLPAAPRKGDEAWSDWIFATELADLTPIPDSERFAIRYRVHPIER
jgi:MFS family permease